MLELSVSPLDEVERVRHRLQRPVNDQCPMAALRKPVLLLGLSRQTWTRRPSSAFARASGRVSVAMLVIPSPRHRQSPPPAAMAARDPRAGLFSTNPRRQDAQPPLDVIGSRGRHGLDHRHGAHPGRAGRATTTTAWRTWRTWRTPAGRAGRPTSATMARPSAGGPGGPPPPPWQGPPPGGPGGPPPPPWQGPPPPPWNPGGPGAPGGPPPPPPPPGWQPGPVPPPPPWWQPAPPPPWAPPPPPPPPWQPDASVIWDGGQNAWGFWLGPIWIPL